MVQGVGFRYYVRNRAMSLGVSGYAKNQSDGSVEVIAQGDEDSLIKLTEALNAGPAGAEVTGVEWRWVEIREDYQGFKTR